MGSREGRRTPRGKPKMKLGNQQPNLSKLATLPVITMSKSVRSSYNTVDEKFSARALPSRMVLKLVGQTPVKCLTCSKDLSSCHAYWCAICFNHYCRACGPEPVGACPYEAIDTLQLQSDVNWESEVYVRFELVLTWLDTSRRSALPAMISKEVSLALVEHSVKESEVVVHNIKFRNDGVYTVADVRIRPLNLASSALGIKRELKAALKNEASSLCACSLQPHAESSKVTICRSLLLFDRMLFDRFPQYKIEETALAELVECVDASAEAYGKVDRILQQAEPSTMTMLSTFKSMSVFEGKLMQEDKARAANLKPDWAMQYSRNFEQLMEHAAVAQHLLKETVAPGSEWAATDMNNREKFPLDDPRRMLKNGTHLSQGGIAFDPGIKGKDRVDEKAQSRNRNKKKPPAYYEHWHLVDLARLGITFNTADDLLASLHKWLDTGLVCWLDNKFHHPSAVGYADVNLGIQFVVGEEHGFTFKHVCEVQLLLAPVVAFKMGEGHRYYECMREVLADSGVKNQHQQAVQQLILKTMDHTAGWKQTDHLVRKLAEEHASLLEHRECEIRAREIQEAKRLEEEAKAEAEAKAEQERKEREDQRRRTIEMQAFLQEVQMRNLEAEVRARKSQSESV